MNLTIEDSTVIKIFFFFPWRNSPYSARASSLSRFHDYRHTTLSRNTDIDPLTDNTQQSQKTDICALNRI